MRVKRGGSCDPGLKVARAVLWCQRGGTQIARMHRRWQASRIPSPLLMSAASYGEGLLSAEIVPRNISWHRSMNNVSPTSRRYVQARWSWRAGSRLLARIGGGRHLVLSRLPRAFRDEKNITWCNTRTYEKRREQSDIDRPDRSPAERNTSACVARTYVAGPPQPPRHSGSMQGRIRGLADFFCWVLHRLECRFQAKNRAFGHTSPHAGGR